MSRMKSESYEKQAILYGAQKMHKNSIMGTRCVYNWTDMMVDMGLDNIVHNDREPRHSNIFNSLIKDWDSDILRTRYQENEKRVLHKCNNMRFLDDKENKTYIISPYHFEFKWTTRRNNQYCVVWKPLDWRDGDNLDLLISR